MRKTSNHQKERQMIGLNSRIIIRKLSVSEMMGANKKMKIFK